MNSKCNVDNLDYLSCDDENANSIIDYSELLPNSIECDYKSVDDLNTDYKNYDKFTVLQMNCRSLPKNFHSINIFINSLSFKPSVICVSETWLESDTNITNIYKLHNYVFLSRCRKSKRGGGVGMYVRNDLEFTDITALYSFEDTVFECLLVEINLKNKSNIIVASLYRPPGTDLNIFTNGIPSFLMQFDKRKNKKLIIAGDFNVNLINYESHQTTNDFVNHMLSHSLFPTISRPTRVTDTSSTLIDNIFSDCFDKVTSACVIYEDFSDHFPTFTSFDFYAKIIEPPIKCCRPITKANLEKFYAIVTQVNWQAYLTHIATLTSTTNKFDIFLNKFTEIFKECFPEKNVNVKQNSSSKQWMTNALIACCKKKSQLYKSFRRNPNDANRVQFKNYSNCLKSCIRTAECNYYSEMLSNSAHSTFETWRSLKIILNNKNTNLYSHRKFMLNDQKIETPKEIADNFNKYFVTIGPDLAKLIPQTNDSYNMYMNNRITDSMSLFPTDQAEIKNIISMLKSNTSPGYDGIPCNVIKCVSESISGVLANLINDCMLNGVFPEKLKIAKVTPVYKSGDKSSFSNYRPISVLCVFSKIFEKVISCRLLNYIDKHNILYDKQFGFRAGHSTYMALTVLIKEITSALDEKQIPVAVSIDLSKAFDTLDHNILLGKLQLLGIRGIVLDFLRNYLTNRVQYVMYNGVYSEVLQIVCGVPQGSILGPLLFLLYMNDISKCSNILQFIMFADDTTVFLKCNKNENISIILNEELKKLATWFQVNKLSLNVNKTKYIVFSCRGQAAYLNESVSINNVQVVRDNVVKFLGVNIDCNLNWKYHVLQISNRISSIIGILRKIRYKLSLESSLLIYDALIASHLSYCNICWASTYKTNLLGLYMLQKRALKLCLYDIHNIISDPFDALKRLDIYKLNEYCIGVFMYMYINKLLPRAFDNFVDLTLSLHAYDTRNINQYNSKYSRTTIRRFSLDIRGPDVWNKIAIIIRSLMSLQLFKNKYRNSLNNNKS